jgi:hypothetical protein
VMAYVGVPVLVAVVVWLLWQVILAGMTFAGLLLPPKVKSHEPIDADMCLPAHGSLDSQNEAARS